MDEQRSAHRRTCPDPYPDETARAAIWAGVREHAWGLLRSALMYGPAVGRMCRKKPLVAHAHAGELALVLTLTARDGPAPAALGVRPFGALELLVVTALRASPDPLGLKELARAAGQLRNGQPSTRLKLVVSGLREVGVLEPAKGPVRGVVLTAAYRT